MSTDTKSKLYLVTPEELARLNDPDITENTPNIQESKDAVQSGQDVHKLHEELNEPQVIKSSPESPAIPQPNNITATRSISPTTATITSLENTAIERVLEKSCNTFVNKTYPLSVPLTSVKGVSCGPVVSHPFSRPHSDENIQMDHASDLVARSNSKLPPPTRQSRPSSRQQTDRLDKPMKVRKTRPGRKRKPLDVSGEPESTTHLTPANEGPSQQDLLTILMFRIQQDKRARDNEKAIEQVKDAELDQSRLTCRKLETRLQYMLSKEKEQNDQIQLLMSKEKEQDAQLSKYRNDIPGLISAHQRLKDYLRGLTNDHNKLRDDAKTIQKQQESLEHEKSMIHDALKDTHAMARHDTDTRAKIVTEVKHHIDFLQQTIHNQSTQLHEKQDLLNHECERNRHFEININNASENHRQLMDCVINYRHVVSSKLDNIFKVSQDRMAQSKTDENDYVKSMLNQCLTSIGELEKKESLNPEDLQLLNSSINAHVERYVPATESARKQSPVYQLM